MTENKEEEIPHCGNCPKYAVKNNPNVCCSYLYFCNGKQMGGIVATHTSDNGCLFHPGARAYLNKDAIAELERLKEEARNEHNGAMSYGLRLNRGGRIDMAEVAIALLRGDVEYPTNEYDDSANYQALEYSRGNRTPEEESL